MKGIILEHKKNGVYIMDKDGCFHFIKGFRDCQIGFEIEISRGNKAAKSAKPLFAPP